MDSDRASSQFLRSIVIAGGAAIVACGSFSVWNAGWIDWTPQSVQLRVKPSTAAEIAAERADIARIKQLKVANANHKALQMVAEFSGVQNPQLIDANKADLDDATAVIGISSGELDCAFVLKDMTSPKTHILNLVMGGQPVSVTYCNLVDCVRVVTEDSDDAIPLNVGGLDVDDQLVFELRGTHYGQSSETLPLDDLPFTRTRWGAWKREHPSTKVWMQPTKT
ncbi:DUF3179 domain-containing protein [Stieleria sp. TO1_6]|uniref:DUF3179 domain-containing (seleno)protein n=1 Tax=Stieleria tagensis TaxID=2956795 RepID=UPI00209AEA71|nr:DUF3179 domain-containing (seleno)protein [Stieleria tagensis]MCO8121588.1 DUF3179 domain-containing protein [Stieleria tagensis]